MYELKLESTGETLGTQPNELKAMDAAERLAKRHRETVRLVGRNAGADLLVFPDGTIDIILIETI